MKYTVISLFDGMSCGQIALDNLGVSYDRYFASEVDKYAISVTQHNYHNTIQIGDVSKLVVKKLRSGVILISEFGDRYFIPSKIILHGGSPCQGFSFAGKQKGASTKCKIDITTLEQYLTLKDDGFEFEGQSYLFWEYVRILRIVQPDVFLLENVIMAKKWLNMFNDAIGVQPIKINSALVSAQNRNRFYWTNIVNIEQPKDEGIVIADILEDDVDEKYFMSQKMTLRALSNVRSRAFTKDKDKTGTLLANQSKVSTDGLYHIANIDVKGHDLIKRVYSTIGKSPTINTCTGGNREVKILDNIPTLQQWREVGGTRVSYKKVFNSNIIINANGKMDANKTGTLVATYYKRNGVENFGSCPFLFEYPRVRKLTPTECERLQTVPDGYTSIVSNSQRYKMLGNGWTIKVIEHIYKSL